MGRRHAHQGGREGARRGTCRGGGRQALPVASAEHDVRERAARSRGQGRRRRGAPARVLARVLPGAAGSASDHRDHADRRHVPDSGARRRAPAPDRDPRTSRRSIHPRPGRARRRRQRRGRVAHRRDRTGDRRLMRAVNLLPSEETRTRRTPTEGGRNAVPIIAAAGGAVVILALAIAAAVASSDVKSGRTDLEQARAELARTPAHASSSLARNRLLSARERRTLALASTLSRRVAWDRILRRLALVMPDDVWLTNLTGTTPTSTTDASAVAATASTA